MKPGLVVHDEAQCSSRATREGPRFAAESPTRAQRRRFRDPAHLDDRVPDDPTELRDWSHGTLASSTGPYRREVFGITYDTKRSVALLFGGFAYNPSGDTWQYR